MNDSMEQIEEILKDVVGNDVTTIIMPMLYPRCYLCNNLEYINFCLDLYDHSWVCGRCYIENEFHTCQKCKRLYPFRIFNWCSICLDNCSLYCPKHLKDKYKIIYDKDIRIIMDVLDDIIDIIGEDTTFDNRYY